MIDALFCRSGRRCDEQDLQPLAAVRFYRVCVIDGLLPQASGT